MLTAVVYVVLQRCSDSKGPRVYGGAVDVWRHSTLVGIWY